MPALHSAGNTITAGASADGARAAIILVHGRGGTPESMLPLADAFGRDDILYLAPRATGNTWYPNSFLAPIEANEPWLSSALEVLAALVTRLGGEGFPAERVAIIGFSQGACLASEFAARNARRYGMIGALTGGLIGPPGTPRAYQGSLDGTPVFIGSSDVDPHVPLERVEETTAVLTRLGATVDERIYPGMGHTVNDDEVEAVRVLVEAMVVPTKPPRSLSLRGGRKPPLRPRGTSAWKPRVWKRSLAGHMRCTPPTSMRSRDFPLSEDRRRHSSRPTEANKDRRSACPRNTATKRPAVQAFSEGSLSLGLDLGGCAAGRSRTQRATGPWICPPL